MLKGDIEVISVPTVVQLCSQEKKSGCLSLYEQKEKIGEIFLKNGQIIAARTSYDKGEKAFYKLMALKKGEFSFENNIPFPEQDIHLPCEYLFLEAARQQDEKRSYLENLEEKLATQISKIEEEFSFEKVYKLFSKIAQLLAEGEVECIWVQDENNYILFIETPQGLLKISLLPQVGLEEAITQIKEIVEES